MKSFGRKFTKAVSPLLATMILIAITVAAGLIIYNLFFTTAGAISTQLTIQINTIDVVKASDITLVSVTIKNAGNKPITSCNVTFHGDSGTSLTMDLGSIDVGQSVSKSYKPSASQLTVTVGKTYPVQIEVAASDGSKLSKATTVTCIG
jgi:hypothetical protein